MRLAVRHKARADHSWAFVWRRVTDTGCNDVALCKHGYDACQKSSGGVRAAGVILTVSHLACGQTALLRQLKLASSYQ